jgi:hypothetical protein
MIDGAENLRTLFDVFHDGCITAGDLVAGTLRLSIEIAYLAERINPAFTSFQVTLHEVSELSFSPWTNADPVTLHKPAEIFAAELEILDCASAGERLTITCNQDADRWGGVLAFQASAASVLDEAGRSHSLAGLIALATAYWDEWEAGNRERQSQSP